MRALLRQCRWPGAGLAFVALATCLAGGGCARTHLTASHGRAYHEVFAAQDANPNRQGTKSVHGLDSNEAAIIAGSYRKALAPKASEGSAQGQLLMMSPNRPGAEAVVAPSVPQGN